jgi:predicted MFS family arabinose efflux permease
VNILRAIFLMLVNPGGLERAEARESLPLASDEHRAYAVRRAFWQSLALVLMSALLGYLAGVALGSALGCAPGWAIKGLQIVGAGILLWATLFVRGWEIQSYRGVTLTERVNRWIYRSMYCKGTVVLVASLSWCES